MTDSLSMFRISVFLCNILGCPAAAVAISQTQTKKMVCLCPSMWCREGDAGNLSLPSNSRLLPPLPPAAAAASPTYPLHQMLPPLHSAVGWRLFLSRLLYWLWAWWERDSESRLLDVVPCAKKSAKKRQAQRRKRIWTDELMNCLPSILQSPPDILSSTPHRNTRDSLADLWSTLTICSMDLSSPLLYALWVWCLISWIFLVFLNFYTNPWLFKHLISSSSSSSPHFQSSPPRHLFFPGGGAGARV